MNSKNKKLLYEAIVKQFKREYIKTRKKMLNEGVTQYKLVWTQENEQFGDSEEIHGQSSNIRDLTKIMYDELAETFDDYYFELTHEDEDEDEEYENINKNDTMAVIRFIKKYYTTSDNGEKYVNFYKNGCTLYNFDGLSHSWHIEKVSVRENNKRSKWINIIKNSDITSMFNITAKDTGDIIALLFANNEVIDKWIESEVGYGGGDKPYIEIKYLNGKFYAIAVAIGYSSGTKYTVSIDSIEETSDINEFINNFSEFFMYIINGEDEEIDDNNSLNNKKTGLNEVEKFLINSKPSKELLKKAENLCIAANYLLEQLNYHDGLRLNEPGMNFNVYALGNLITMQYDGSGLDWDWDFNPTKENIYNIAKWSTIFNTDFIIPTDNIKNKTEKDLDKTALLSMYWYLDNKHLINFFEKYANSVKNITWLNTYFDEHDNGDKTFFVEICGKDINNFYNHITIFIEGFIYFCETHKRIKGLINRLKKDEYI